MMTRDDWSFLLEKAAALVLIVIGIVALPDLIDVWIGGVGAEDPSPRYWALRALIPLAAGAFLWMRRKSPSAGAATPGTVPPTAAAAMGRADWLWVGCKVVGAVACLYGLGNLVHSLGWMITGLAASTGRSREILVLIGSVASSAIHVIGGAWLFFGERVWRLACREVPATR
ncbi:MAG TPA: hypothetical protein VFV95_21605 [Vicinamibacterales bacterium]|nr:hypothetical protein [Vicinamibacterales bacterium]